MHTEPTVATGLRLTSTCSLKDFQNFISQVYGQSDDRLFDNRDLVMNQERFTMRALKGIRKNDHDKLKRNLMISCSWLMAVANRFHVDLDEAVWKRFPYFCSYCAECPCVCKKEKPTKRRERVADEHKRPANLREMQAMFKAIYPPESRSLPDAGVHLAEEMGEVSEAIQVYFGEHKHEQFDHFITELADYISCVIGVANSASIDLAAELEAMYYENCHACHTAPCSCNFDYVAKYSS